VKASLGEFGLIERFFAQPARANNLLLEAGARPLLGIGDDCALLAADQAGRAIAVSTDMLVQGRHFFADVDPVALGHKALAVNLSDLAAMGARPVGFTLALALPEVNKEWLAGFSKGMLALAQRCACPLIGGDTTRGPLTISITVMGEVLEDQALRRDRAQLQDSIWVSGRLGGAALAVAALARGEGLHLQESAKRALEWPEPRLALGQALAASGLGRAAIDVSDGLLGDLAHILSASQCPGAVIKLEQVPWAPSLEPLPIKQKIQYGLAGGDDYELLFTAPASASEGLLAIGRELSLQLSCIGELTSEPTIRLQDASGELSLAKYAAYDHFRESDE
jgi:thiamine-monophosphate kinase